MPGTGWGSVSLFLLLDLSVVFDAIDHGIRQAHLSGTGLGGKVLPWFCPSWMGELKRVVLGESCLTP